MLNKNGLQSPELGDFTQSRSWIMEPVLRYPCPALLAQGWTRIMKALKTKLTFTRFRHIFMKEGGLVGFGKHQLKITRSHNYGS